MSKRDFGVPPACRLLQISRALYRYCSRRAGCARLSERIPEIAATKCRYGYRGIYIRLGCEGWAYEADCSCRSSDLEIQARMNTSRASMASPGTRV